MNRNKLLLAFIILLFRLPSIPNEHAREMMQTFNREWQGETVILNNSAQWAYCFYTKHNADVIKVQDFVAPEGLKYNHNGEIGYIKEPLTGNNYILLSHLTDEKVKQYLK